MGYMTDERRMIQETARAFAMKEVLPLANKLDPEKGDIPRELIRKLADMGYFGIVIPEQYGGLGLGVFEYCLITEELARAWMSVASHHRPRQRPQRRPRHDRRPARGVPAARRARRVPGRRRHVGARRRLGPRQHLLPRPQGRRRLGDQRQQVLVHLRRRRRLHHAGRPHVGFARPQAQACRPVVVPDREAARDPAAGREGRADPQDRLLRLEDLGARLRQLPPAGRGADRRGRPRLLLHLRRAGAAPAPTPPRARSAWRAARWRTRRPMRRSGGSSARRSASSRTPASGSPAWRPRSRRRAS